MPTITFPSGSTIRTDASQAVYLRAQWTDSWVLTPYLHCTRLTKATGESLSNAEFYWRFGSVLRSGQTIWATHPVTAINPRSYVRVVFSGSDGRAGTEWVGLWDTAVKADTSQTFRAVGIERLLAEPCLTLPHIFQGTWRDVGRGVEFDAAGKANRSAGQYGLDGGTAYVFDWEALDFNFWSTREAVRLLLSAAAPRDLAGDVVFQWQPNGLENLPDFDRVRLPTHGRTYLELLRALITRYRLVGWDVRVSGGTVYFDVYTFAESAIDLKDGGGNVVGTIPANGSQDALVFAADQTSRASLVTAASHVADQVIVTGDRRQIVFSLSNKSSELEMDRLWEDDLQDEYDAGASGEDDYPGPDDVYGREQRDRDARAEDKYRPVYSWFGPSDDWDQQAGNGESGGDRLPVATEADGETQFWLYPPAIRFLPQLPLLSNYVHAGDAIETNQDTARYHAEEIAFADITPAHEPLPLLVFARTVAAIVDPDGKDRWQLLDQLGRTKDLECHDDGTNRRWSADVRPLADRLGIEVRVQGEQQHVVAVSYSTIADSVQGAMPTDPWIYTVAIEDPRAVELRYPADDDLTPLGDLVQRLRIEAPGYQLVEVRPETVVAVDASMQLVRSAGGLLIDDRDEMAVLAQRTYEWHKVPRYALQWSTRWIDGAVQIGHLITEITDAQGTWPVRSVVTEISYEFPVADGTASPAPRMTVVTAFGELGSG